MPWYKTGTVNVTLNSNTVTGSGTAFIVNSRVGDGFRGPDGRWYEIINVASDTAIAIDPPYQGTSEATGAYALAPMQGYVKDSADQLRVIVNTYGAKLAALGTTGNYDVLPLSKGGTGGTTQAEARTELGLGSVASDNVVPVARGGTSGTTQAEARTGLGLGAVSTDNVVPVVRGGTGGTTQASARTALGLKSAAVADIVGTVSESGGMPTGDVIERGSNANGEYVRFADGSQICWIGRVDAQAIDTSFGGGYISPFITWTFPMPFNASPACSLSGRRSSALSFPVASGSSLTALTYYHSALISYVSASISAQLIAIGRWY